MAGAYLGRRGDELFDGRYCRSHSSARGRGSRCRFRAGHDDGVDRGYAQAVQGDFQEDAAAAVGTSITAAASRRLSSTSAWRGVRSLASPAGAAGRCGGHRRVAGAAVAGRAAAGGGQVAGQFGRAAQVAEGQAQQCFLFIGPGQQDRAGPGRQDLAGGRDGGQGVADVPAGRPDLRPVQQRQVLERAAGAARLSTVLVR